MKKSFVVLLAVAAGVNLTWAGAITFRVLIDLPARHRIGPAAFAELSRATDLARGLVFYPVVAIGSALLSCAAFFAAWRTRAARPIWLQTGLAAVATLLVLVITAQAAPIMFRIGASPGDPNVLEPLADRFTTLTNLRALFADVGAVGLLCALATCALRIVPSK